MEQYWVWLSSVRGIGTQRFYRLMSLFGDARTVWENIEDKQLAFLGTKAWTSLREARTEQYFYKLFAKLQTAGVHAVTRLTEDYPARLTQIYDPPATLYVKGETDLNRKRTFGIVGSRRCTRDGLRAAQEIAAQLSREEVVVVSGLAQGIDSAAHTGAVDMKCPTIAVMGCGPDVIYPPENTRLYERILENGGSIVSEYLPGSEPAAHHFPQRNRIISGMCSGVLIVEGAKQSGAMITVNYALEQDRDVFAVPGCIYSPLSATPNRLIVEGAIPVLSAQEVLSYYKWADAPEKTIIEKHIPELSEDEQKLVQPLREQSLTMSELCSITGFSAKDTNSLLTFLELRGIIEKQPGGEYRAYL